MNLLKKVEISENDDVSELIIHINFNQKSQCRQTSKANVIDDRMVVQLDGLGSFIATPQKTENGRVTFLFDDCITKRCMNKDDTNKGGYDASDLKEWIEHDLLNAFPEELRDRIVEIGIPSYGQIFGHDDFYSKVMVPDEDDQLPLMKRRRNRVSYYDDNFEWYWLKNSVKKNVSSAAFAFVLGCGNALSSGASYSLGVRPYFVLAN